MIDSQYYRREYADYYQKDAPHVGGSS